MAQRDPSDVIDQVLAVIPEAMTELRTDLSQIKERAGFVAPEDMRGIWVSIASTLNGALPWPPREPWQEQVLAITRGYSPKELV